MKLLYTVVFILILISNDLGDFFEPLKYFKYSGVILFLFNFNLSFGIISRSSFKLNSPLFPFLILIVINVLRMDSYNYFSLLDSLIYFLSILPFITSKKVQPNYKFIILSLILIFIIKFGTSFKLDLSLESFLLSETSSAETNTLPFLFGLFSIFFLIEKKYVFFLISIIMVFFSFKRIVFLSVVISLLFYTLNIHQKKNIRLFLLLANFAWIAISFFIASDIFWDFSIEYTGLPPGQFTQGRSTRYAAVIELFEYNFIWNIIFGLGPGQVRTILEGFHFGDALQLHNDVLKVFLDYGFLIFFFFLLFFYSNKIKIIFVFSLFLNLILLTDNVLIYSPVLILYFSFIYKFIDSYEKSRYLG